MGALCHSDPRVGSFGDIVAGIVQVFGAHIRGVLLLLSLQINRGVVGRWRHLRRQGHSNLDFRVGSLGDSGTGILQVLGIEIRAGRLLVGSFETIVPGILQILGAEALLVGSFGNVGVGSSVVGTSEAWSAFCRYSAPRSARSSCCSACEFTAMSPIAGTTSAGRFPASASSSSASPNTAGDAILKGSKPTLRQMSWMNRNWSLLASASKAFRATSMLLPVSPACGSASVGSSMTARGAGLRRFGGPTFRSACWRLSALRSSSAALRSSSPSVSRSRWISSPITAAADFRLMFTARLPMPTLSAICCGIPLLPRPPRARTIGAQVGLPAQDLARIDRIVASVKREQSAEYGLTPKNRRLLAHFDDPAFVDRLLTFPQRLVEAAKTATNKRHAATRARAPSRSSCS